MATNASLEELYKAQESLGEEIVKFYTNYAKLPLLERKKLSVVNTKITKICELVNKFNETHEIILNSGGQTTHEYFTSGYKDNINNHHESNLDRLLSDKKSIESTIPEIPRGILPSRFQQPTISNTSFVETTPATSAKLELSRLIKQQATAISILKNKMGKVRSRINTSTGPLIEILVEDLNFQWNKISEYHRRILQQINGKSEQESYDVEAYSTLEDDVENLMADLIVKQREDGTSQHNNTFSSPIHRGKDNNGIALDMVHLPKINIPTFEGDILKWPGFKKLFTDMMDKANICDSQKLHYLKTSLVGAAQSMVDLIEMNLDTYASAWKRLAGKYENERVFTSVLSEKLFGQDQVKSDCASALRDFTNLSKECISSLKKVNVDVSDCEALIVHLLIKKVDHKTRELFEHQLEEPKKNPTLNIFFNFLERRSQALESMGERPKKIVAPTKPKTSHLTTSEKKNHIEKGACVCCGEKHQLSECKKFISFDLRKKFNFLFRHKLCCRCLLSGHSAPDCQKPKCQVSDCGKNHNELLHKYPKKTSEKGSESGKIVALSISSDSKFSDKSVSSGENISSSDNKFVFLGTVLLNAMNSTGVLVNCRALLDSCSQLSIISMRMSKRLGLKMISSSTKISGVDKGRASSNSKVSIEISNLKGSFRKRVECVVLSNVSTYSPVEDIDIGSMDVALADPQFNCPETVDLLLGCDVYSKLLRSGVKRLGNGLPDLVNTVFGWVVMGTYVKSFHQTSPFCGVSAEEAEFYLNAPKLWDMEAPTSNNCLSLDDQRVESIFDKTTVRAEDGKFIVTLPRVENQVPLGNSYNKAFQRFLSLENRFSKDSSLFKRYYDFLNEYLTLGHMVKTNRNKIPKSHFYLPHHAVFKEDSSTTKIRVVFDGSCKTDSNVSLNDNLSKGPILQEDIVSLLLRFRTFKFVMCADIAKMFRQVWVSEADQFHQLILWRNKPSDSISVYRLKTITYGTAPATYLATKCIQTLALEHKEQFPISSEVLLKDMYVDDLITGSNKIEDLLQVQSEVVRILSSGGFHLRKWVANVDRLLEDIPHEDKEIKLLGQSESELVKTLGIIWKPQRDMFSLVIQDFVCRSIVTKRIITAEAGCVYDPLGFVTPVLLRAKIMIQYLWKKKFDWDEELPHDISSRWKDFRSEVQSLRELEIPRFVCSDETALIELHGFSDASKSAYGAAVYVRSTCKDGDVYVNLLTSRSKVSPISDMSIPRLELAAAKLLIELMTKVKDSLRCVVKSLYYWTDSQVVLWWLKKPSSNFKPFVANRVSFIQEFSDIDDWHHVPGDQNPADIVSRGCTVSELRTSKWFKGPSFLLSGIQDWPPQNVAFELNKGDLDSEIKRSAVVMVLTEEEFESSNMFLINHRNSFDTLHRIVGFIFRFFNNCRNRSIHISDKKSFYSKIADKENQREIILENVKPLSVDELDNSLKGIVRYLQSSLCDPKSKKGDFVKLLPFVDNENIIRVGGRLKNARIPFDAKHQILLPKCKITLMLIRKLHFENIHCPPQTLLSIVRQNYWPIDGARSCSKIFFHCVRCFKSRPRDIKQLMGDLPSSRTDMVAPFANTGVDYAGPFKIHYTIRGKRPTTAYVAVFVCFAVKAVHLELVSDLTSAAFFAALKRFIARRGKPLSMHSDNATNFIGCKNELSRLYEFIIANSNAISNFAASRGIEWKPIPPGSPHFGGLWESSVKRMKYHLVHLLQNRNLTFEELNTVLIEIEAVLNSRPLTYQSENPADVKPLTPNNFLISGEAQFILERDMSNDKPQLIRRWEIISKIRQEYWQRLSLEYFHTLQSRSKWLKLYENLQENSVVLIKNENSPPMHWEMGLVVGIVKGDDNIVRVVDVKTSQGIKRRAITKVCPFPPLDENSMFSWSNGKLAKNESAEVVSHNVPSSSSLQSNASKQRSSQLKKSTQDSIKKSRNPVNITKFEHHPGIYFDGVGRVNIVNNEWHILMYFNLSTYWTQCTNFNLYVSNLKNLCDNKACQQVTQQLSGKVKEIEEFNVLIRQECQMKEHFRANRTRRSYRAPLDVFGRFAHKWFGVLDSDYGEMVENALENVKSNEDRMLLMIKNQTSIMNNTVNLIKRNNKEIEEKLYKLYNDSVYLSDLLKKESKHIMFNTIASSLFIALSDYSTTQRQIHDTLKDFKKGNLNPFLIHRSDFEEHLRSLQANLGAESKLPSTHYSEIQSVARMATVFGSNCLIFQVEIPLLGRVDHDLYRMIPVPTYSKNVSTYLKPFRSYLAISLQEQTYYFMSTSEFDECVEFYEIRICHKRHAIFKINDDNHCEINFFLHNPEVLEQCDIRSSRQHHFWIELHRPNQWLYSLKEKSKLKAICKGDIPYQFLKIEGEGLVESSNECKVMIDGVELSGTKVGYSTVWLKKIPSVLPQLDIKDDIPIKKSKNPFVVSLQNLDSISDDIEKLKAEEEVTLKSIDMPVVDVWGSGPDAYHIISFSTTGMLLILAISVYLYIKCHKSKPQSTVRFVVPRPGEN